MGMGVDKYIEPEHFSGVTVVPSHAIGPEAEKEMAGQCC